MTETFTAFQGERRLACGPLAEVALAVKRAEPHASDPIAIFSDVTGNAIDLDHRGNEDEVRARSSGGASGSSVEPNAQSGLHGQGRTRIRPRGRPRLGVVAREVTLLPRHWQWLNAQPGGASVALRRLLDEATGAYGDQDDRRARDAAYRFMSAMAGNLANFEQAARALFANDRRRLAGEIAAWPSDIRDHVVKLAFGDHAELIA